MVPRVVLIGLAILVAVVQASDKHKLETDTTLVAKKLQEKVTEGALQPDGLTQEKLETITTTTLGSLKATMKELKKLDAKSEKVPDKIVNKLATGMKKVMKDAKMNQEEIDQNINSMKVIAKKKIEEYQNAK